MNAIISLCHFCDTHGPKTLFCTQAFKYLNTSNEHTQLQTSSTATATPKELMNESTCKVNK
jgi:hypothetical protein